MKEALRAVLLADAGVSELLGGSIVWGRRNRGDPLPSIALHQISGLRDYAMAGPTGLVEARVQVDCWALTNAEATAVARAVNAALGGLRTTVDGVQIQGAFLINETDYTEGTVPPPNEVLARVSHDYSIWHSE